MNIQIGGATLAVILTGMLLALGVSECQRGPLNPELADNLSEEQKTWLTVEHRIKRFDPSLTSVARDQQTLTITYRPDAAPHSDEAWASRLLRVVGHGLAALNGAPGGREYTQVTVKARLLADDDVKLVYDMQGFDALKTRRNSYSEFASAPRSLSLSSDAWTRVLEECRSVDAQAFYPDFCERVKSATVIQH